VFSNTFGLLKSQKDQATAFINMKMKFDLFGKESY